MSAATAPDRRQSLTGVHRALRSRFLSRLDPIEWLLMALIVAVPAALIWRYASPSYFFSDDLSNLFNAHTSHVSLSYAFGSAIGHLAPGYRLAYQALDRVAPFNFELALAFLIACHAVSTVLLQRILQRIFGRIWWTYALAFAWAISIIYLPAFAFFAAGILSLPAITATVASMHAYLCWRTTGRRSWLIWSLVAMAIGLAFYTKAILIPVYLVLMRVLLLDPRASLRDSLRSVRDEWRVWAAYAAVCVLYLIVYFVGPYQRVSGGVTVDQVVTYLRVFWAEGFWPMVFGVRIPQYAHTDAQDVFVVAAQLLLLAGVIWSIDRRSTAWRAWAFLAIAIVLNALVVIGRVAEWGAVAIGYYVRYYTEPALLVPIALAFAFATPRLRARVAPVRGSRVPRRTDEKLRLPGLRTGLVALAVLAVYVAVTWATTDSFSHPWSDKPFTSQISNGRTARAYFEHLRGDLAAARRAGEKPSLLDQDLPPTIITGFANLGRAHSGVRYTALSAIVPLFDSQVTFNHPQWLHVVMSDGHMKPTQFVPAAHWSAARRSRAVKLQVTGTKVATSPTQWCVTATVSGSAVTLTPRQPLRGRDWWLRASYQTDLSVPYALQNNAGLGFGGAHPVVPAEPFAGTAIISLGELPTGAPTNAGVRILVPPSHRLCVQSLEIGSFSPPISTSRT
jgi:hypothetical protein